MSEKLKKFFLAFFVAAFLPVTLTHTKAAPVSFSVNFFAQGFFDNFGLAPPPVNAVTGSFTITFDPTLTYLNSSTGISLTSLNIQFGSALGGTLAFNYDSSGVLRVGGLVDGVTGVPFNPARNDFILNVPNFLSAPFLGGFTYAQSALNGSIFRPNNQTGFVTVNSVPVPATLPLFASGLGVLGLIVLRRRRAISR